MASELTNNNSAKKRFTAGTNLPSVYNSEIYDDREGLLRDGSMSIQMGTMTSNSSSTGHQSTVLPVKNFGLASSSSNSGASDAMRKFWFGRLFEILLYLKKRGYLSIPSCCIGSILLILFVSMLPITQFMKILLISLIISIQGLLMSGWIVFWIFKFNEGSEQMKEVSNAIREGSEGFFSVQYATILPLSLALAAALCILYIFRGGLPNEDQLLQLKPLEDTLLNSTYPEDIVLDETTVSNEESQTNLNAMASAEHLSSLTLGLITAFCCCMGSLCSSLTGYSGMWVSVRTNSRVAEAARHCYNDAIQLCFRGGAFSSLINVSLAVGGISLLLLLLMLFFPSIPITHLPLLVVGYGFGASVVAMFAQLGGGIYTKAADVGADLVGKIELDIPEDDPRNPAVIADLVGDNVGDCAGQCADVFESIAAEIIAAMILGATLSQRSNLPVSLSHGYILFPLAVHCMDIIISTIGMFLVRTTKGFPNNDTYNGKHNPMKIMLKGYIITCILGLIGFLFLCRMMLYDPLFPNSWKNFSLCGIIGMLCALLCVIVTQYYTDYEYTQVRRIAEASVTGPATNIIAGLSVGLESTAFPVLIISIALLTSYYLGCSSDISINNKNSAGIFGTAVSTMGMLSTAVFVLSMSSFGPIADNAGGIVEMSEQPQHVRVITDKLDAAGNVTKANTKGFSIGSASLASFLLFSAFMDEVSLYSKVPFKSVDISKPEVFVAGLIGSMVVFLFASWSMESVGRAAQCVVKEVRRQFSAHPGILEYKEKPDYHACVAIVSRSALKEMIKPGLLAILSPVVIGLSFKLIGSFVNDSLLGAESVASFLMFSTATGILMALFLNNAGGAWDNAKKWIETGMLGGKGSEAHKAAVVGDTVGDPSKDTAGPSIHVLIKLVSTVSLVLTPIFIQS